jgi:FkbM family methyltransferase
VMALKSGFETRFLDPRSCGGLESGRHDSCSPQPTMKRTMQLLCLGVYRTIRHSGVLSTAWGMTLFEWSYRAYKRFVEVGDIRVLGRFVNPGTVVIDVGANIGFFTRYFGRWVSHGGRVIAIEPEESNFQRLTRMLSRSSFGQAVEPIQAVAADQTGVLNLKVNPLHPADHRIAPEGIPVRSVSLDGLLAARNWPLVSLIKIDVQGAEAMVLEGARQTMERFHPAVFLEIDDANLRTMNADAEGVFRLFERYGYVACRVTRGRISSPLNTDECLKLCRAMKYADFLFLQPKSIAANALEVSGSARSRTPLPQPA